MKRYELLEREGEHFLGVKSGTSTFGKNRMSQGAGYKKSDD